MFTGVYKRRIDEKGRLILPSNYFSQEEKIFLYPQKSFNENIFLYGFLQSQEEEFSKLELNSYWPLLDFEPDTQNRILLPKLIRNLIMTPDRETLVIGHITHFSLWNPDKYKIE